MTEKEKSNIQNAVLSFVVATASALIVWGFAVADTKKLNFKEDIETLKIEKANKCDVNTQIKELETRTGKRIDDNYQVINEKLDLIIKLTEK